MKILRGIIRKWDKCRNRGELEEWDNQCQNTGILRSFAMKDWEDEYDPEVEGSVFFSLDGAGNVAHVWLANMEPPKFVRGPGRMYLDARAWLHAAKRFHDESLEVAMPDDLRSMFGEMEAHIICYRGSLIKYCYALAIELYLKWLLTEYSIGFAKRHGISDLIPLLPSPVLTKLRQIYAGALMKSRDGFRLMEIDAEGVREVKDLDWSDFDSFVGNIDTQRFVMGRYATPQDYSIYRSRFGELWVEMNRYMDSMTFFDVADEIVAFVPGYRAGDQQFPLYGVRARIHP